MTKLKKWIPTAVALLAFFALGAQPGREMNRDRLREALQLKPEQETRFFETMDKLARELSALRDSRATDIGQRRAAAGKIMEAHRKEMAAILSKEQMEKLRAMRTDRMRKARPRDRWQGIGARGAAARPALPNPELVKAVQDYSQKEILPVLKKERAELEKRISPKDRVILSSLRTQAKALRGQRLKGPGPRGAVARRPAGRGNTPLDKLAEKYSSDLDRIFSGLEPHVDRWNKDLSALREKSAVPDRQRGRGMQAGRPVPPAMRLIEPHRFLLLDPRS
ncbi:MAG: hypothetical protein ACOYOO_05710 [Saprospiraceae bacterium]